MTTPEIAPTPGERPANVQKIDSLLEQSAAYDKRKSEWDRQVVVAKTNLGVEVGPEPKRSQEEALGAKIIERAIGAESKLEKAISDQYEEVKGAALPEKVVSTILKKLDNGDEASPYIAASMLIRMGAFIPSADKLNLGALILEKIPNAKYYAEGYMVKVIDEVAKAPSKTEKGVPFNSPSVEKMIDVLLDEKGKELSTEQKQTLNTAKAERSGYKKFVTDIVTNEYATVNMSPVMLSEEINAKLKCTVTVEQVKSAIEMAAGALDGKPNMDGDGKGFLLDLPKVLVLIGRQMDEGDDKDKVWGYAMGMIEGNLQNLPDPDSGRGNLRRWEDRVKSAASAMALMFDHEKDGDLAAFATGNKVREDTSRSERITNNKVVQQRMKSIWTDYSNVNVFNQLISMDRKQYLDVWDKKREAKLLAVQEVDRVRLAAEENARTAARKAIIEEASRNPGVTAALELIMSKDPRTAGLSGEVADRIEKQALSAEATNFAKKVAEEIAILVNGKDKDVVTNTSTPISGRKGFVGYFSTPDQVKITIVARGDAIRERIQKLEGEDAENYDMERRAKIEALRKVAQLGVKVYTMNVPKTNE